ncbi:MAG: hypothetical protein JXQ93_04605 [Flavobacteriaceae bacterium]
MTQSNAKWSLFQKISFRFIFIYFGLYISTFYISYIPYTTSFVRWLTYNIQSIPVWVADKFMGIKITVFPNGSGDTTYNYVEVLTFFMLAVIAVIIWSVIDKRRANYKRLLLFFSIYVCYYVAINMFSYGFSKIFYLQFSAPSLSRLLQPYGSSSPMGIAWVFMGASKTYTMFSGFAEVLGGLLLLHRRTRTFGALTVFCVMLNVFMMNMSYDIPVKLFSFHLMIMMLFVSLLGYKRIVNLFGLKKALQITPPVSKYFKNRRMSLSTWVLKLIFLSYSTYVVIDNNLSYANQTYNSPKPILYGIYDVDTYVLNKDTIPPLLTDKIRWKKIISDGKWFSDYIIVKGMNDQTTWYKQDIDTINNTLEMVSTRDSTNVYNFHYIKKDSVLSFKGLWNQDSVEIKMKEFDLKKFRLTNRGFHWINEYPYNR